MALHLIKLAVGVTDLAHLRQLQRERGGALLTLRGKLRRRQPTHFEPEIITLRADRRQTQARIFRAHRLELGGEVFLVSGQIAERERFTIADRAVRCFRRRPNPLHERAAHFA